MVNITTHGFHGRDIDDCPWNFGLSFLFDATDNSVDKLAARNALT